MELPRDLAPWAEQLALFRSELIQEIGPMVRQIDRVVGPIRMRAHKGEGEPDGFDGLVRRGPYERLLISEWLLTEEAPDEFTRRAAMGEHAFLQPARRTPAEGRASVALFDAGPDQIGAPRIAHLAALIVLARRAESAGAVFRWAVMHHPEELCDRLTPGDIRRMFGRRTAVETSDDRLRDWRERLCSEIGEDDLWLIGGVQLAALPSASGASLFLVADPLEPGVRCLNARIRRSNQADHTLTLALPEDRICIRLLRDPFRMGAASPHKIDPAQLPDTNLILTTGRRLLARSRPDRLIVYPYPNSPNASAGKLKSCLSTGGAPILAAGRTGRGYLLLTASPDPAKLRLEHVGPASGRLQVGEIKMPAPTQAPKGWADPRLHACHFLPKAGRTGAYLFELDGCWHLAELGGVAALILHDEGFCVASAVSSVGVHLVFQSQRQNRSGCLWLIDMEGKPRRRMDFVLAGGACFGYGGRITDSGSIGRESDEDYGGLFGYEPTPHSWTLLYKDKEIKLNVPPQDRVIGVTVLESPAPSGEIPIAAPCLVVMAQDRRNLRLIGDDWARTLPSASSRIVQFAVSPYASEIAYTTKLGELVVYSLSQQTVLYRLQGEAEK